MGGAQERPLANSESTFRTAATLNVLFTVGTSSIIYFLTPTNYTHSCMYFPSMEGNSLDNVLFIVYLDNKRDVVCLVVQDAMSVRRRERV